MLSLPPEILGSIFQETSKSTIYECLFVCKSWYPIASRLYYNQLEFISNHVAMLEMVQYKRLDGSSLGDYVQKLVFLYRDKRGRTTRTGGGDLTDPPHGTTRPLTKAQFHSLIFLLPRLQTIQFNAPCTEPSSSYLEYLKQVPKIHLTHLHDIILPVLNSSNLSSSENNAQINYEANVRRSFDTLTRLQLDDTPSFDNQQQRINLLSKMTRLQHLVCRGLDIASVFNACHDLVSLDITHPANTTSNNAIKHHPHLKSLSIHCQDDVSLARILLEGVPTHLDYCHLTVPSLSLPLVRHLKHTRHLLLHTSNDSFWQYVPCLLGDKKVHLELVVFDTASSQQQFIRVREEVHIKLVIVDAKRKNWYPDFIDQVNVKSHVSDINEVMTMLLKRRHRTLQVQCCRSGSSLLWEDEKLTVDGMKLSERTWMTLGALSTRWAEVTLVIGANSRALLSSFQYIKKVRVQLLCETGVHLVVVQQGESHYYCHEKQLVPCSETMESSKWVKLVLCPFEELIIMFGSNKEVFRLKR